MSFIQTYSKEIVSLCVPLVAALIANVFRARAKLQWSEHISRIMITEEFDHVEVGPPRRRDLIVRTASLFVQNYGREPSTEIEIVFNWKPQHINLWPQRQYDHHLNPDGRFIIKLPNLAPKEFLGIDLLTVNREMPNLIQVRSLQGTARRIETLQQPVHPKWKLILVLYSMFMGAVATIYALISGLQWISRTL